jgi:hypothetical protein
MTNERTIELKAISDFGINFNRQNRTLTITTKELTAEELINELEAK